jgi:hypothetical protein
MRFRWSVAATVTALAALPASAPAATSFDGVWSVVIITEKGTCDRAYRYPVRVQNGKVMYGGEASFNVSGQVDARGRVRVSIRRGEQGASASGRLSQSEGAGSWKSFAGECAGNWTAERRS